MGSVNQLNIIKEYAAIINSPILEVGSKDYGNTPDFRSLFPGYEYIGADMEEGNGVDLLLDFTQDFGNIDKKLGGKRFKTIICFSVLEHCKNPFKMCENMSKLLSGDGVIFISVPFIFDIHGYPSDYWRFTPEGIKILFPALRFDKYPTTMSTDITGNTKVIDDMMNRIYMPKIRGHNFNGITGKIFLRLCKKYEIPAHIFDYAYVTPKVMINLIGMHRD